MPAEKIMAATRGQRGMAWPIVDGWVLPDDQYKIYDAKQFNDTPILVGYNSDEGASFSPPHSSKEYIDNTRKRYGTFADSLLSAYPTGETTVPKTARDLSRDAAFGWHTWTWAQMQARLGKGKAYIYYFDQHPDHPADSPQAGYGAPHGRPRLSRMLRLHRRMYLVLNTRAYCRIKVRYSSSRRLMHKRSRCRWPAASIS
jgi:para-nitrobenzyl esterase